MLNNSPREGEQFHPDEVRVPGFDKPNRRLQQAIGPIHLRYVTSGLFMGGEYQRMKRLTGAADAVRNPRERLERELPLVEEMTDSISDFMREYEISGRVTVITPPRSCKEDSDSCTEESQREHIGYMIGERVTNRIAGMLNCQVSHVMAFDLYRCHFVTVTRANWHHKTRFKYGKWEDRVSREAAESITGSNLIIITDDTMLSYMGMIRIAMTVRQYNLDSRILCAGLFGCIRVEHNPEILYPTLVKAVDSHGAR